MGPVFSRLPHVTKVLDSLFLPTYRTGDRVEGNWYGRGKWYPGVVVTNSGKIIHVRYDDDDEENITDQTRLRREKAGKGACSTSMFSVQYDKGTKVLAAWHSNFELEYSATVMGYDDKGMCKVEYGDGEKEVLEPRYVKLIPTAVEESWIKTKFEEIKSSQAVQVAIRPVLELIKPRLQVGDRIEADWCGYGSLYPGRVAGVTTEGSHAPFPIKLKYDDGDEEFVAYENRARVTRVVSKTERLGYEYGLARPSTLGMREPFDSEPTHRFAINERVVIIGVPFVFTVDHRLNHMVKLVADVSGKPPGDRALLMRDFYFPEKHVWLASMEKNVDVFHVVRSNGRLSPEQTLESTPKVLLTVDLPTSSQQRLFDEVTTLCGLNPSDDSIRPRALKKEEVLKLTKRLAVINEESNLALFSDLQILRNPEEYDENQRAEAKKTVERDGRVIRKALDPAVNPNSRRSFFHWIEDDPSNYFRVAEVLLDAGASSNTYDFNGMTPLYLACAKGATSTVEFLLSRGANALLPGPGLMTPIHMMLSPKFNLPPRLVPTALRNRRTKTLRSVQYNFPGLKHLTQAAVTTPLFRSQDAESTADVDLRAMVTELGDGTGTQKKHSTEDCALNVIVRDSHLKALGTPLVQQLLDHQWELFAGNSAVKDAVLAVLLAALFVADTVLHTDTLTSMNPEQALNLSRGVSITLWLSAGYLLWLEIYQLSRDYMAWSRDVWNGLEMAAFSLVVIYESMDILDHFFGALPEPLPAWIESVRAVAAILVWLRILKYVSMFRGAGHLVNIVLKMLKEFASFLLVFSTIFLAFTHAFLVLLRPLADEEELTAVQTIMIAFRTMLGDFEYDRFSDSKTLVILFVIYVLIATVLMLNLLIAQLSNVFAEVQGDAAAEFLLNKARYIEEIENELTLVKKRDYSVSQITYSLKNELPEEITNSLTEEEGSNWQYVSSSLS